MASIADVLRHLVHHAPALSGDHQDEFLAAIDAEPGLHADRAGDPADETAVEQAPASEAPASEDPAPAPAGLAGG